MTEFCVNKALNFDVYMNKQIWMKSFVTYFVAKMC